MRRILGKVVDELHLLARPADATADPVAQATSTYAALISALEAEGAGVEDLAGETIFLRPDLADVAAIVAERLRLFTSAGLSSGGPAASLLGQAPLCDDAPCLEVAAIAIVPHRNTTTTATANDRAAPRVAHSDVPSAATCPCATCAPGYRARVVRVGSQTRLHAGDVFGCGADAVAEAFDMFVAAEKLLLAAGMTFRDVARTWIYLRDIDRDYAALNHARREFFASRGIERRPASTGVQGIPFASAHDFSLGLFAVHCDSPLEISLMSTPTLNEAWTYGADFSRGLRLVDNNKVALIVSGTASIDEYGVSLHEGDLGAQTERMLRNIETLLEEQGAGFADLVSAVTYVKHAADAPALRTLLDARGFSGFPLAIVEAPLCRPELLCETEAVAALPLSAHA